MKESQSQNMEKAFHVEALGLLDQFSQVSDEISSRLSDERLIPRHDAHIARSVLHGLQTRFYREDNPTRRHKILVGTRSLDELVPKWVNNGHRTKARLIGNEAITPGVERLIESRSKATITDIDLGNYPAEVQLALQKHAYFVVEGVNACTVACRYCPVADIGPVRSRLSSKSINTLTKLNQKPYDEKTGFKVTFSGLYDNTDIFDWEGQDSKRRIVDYTRILKDYRKLLRSTPLEHTMQPISSSTSIPWGSELRVLKSVLYLGSLKDSMSKMFLNSMRISLNNANFRRAWAIKNIADVFAPLNKETSYGLDISPNRDDSHMETGRGSAKWENRVGHMSLQDILNIECSDKVVFTPNGIRNEFGVALTEDNKKGHQSLQFAKNLPDGGIEYWILHNSLYFNEDQKIFDGSETQNSVDFPDPTFTVIQYDRVGNFVSTRDEHVADNPFRVFYKLCRLLGIEIPIKGGSDEKSSKALFKFCDYDDKNISINMEEYRHYQDVPEVQSRLNLIRGHARSLQDYLSTGHGNHVISMVLSKIAPLLPLQ